MIDLALHGNLLGRRRRGPAILQRRLGRKSEPSAAPPAAPPAKRNCRERNGPSAGLQSIIRPPRRVLMGRGILLWLLGVPIPVIILLALFYR